MSLLLIVAAGCAVAALLLAIAALWRGQDPGPVRMARPDPLAEPWRSERYGARRWVPPARPAANGHGTYTEPDPVLRAMDGDR